jgi:hypothetical protein
MSCLFPRLSNKTWKYDDTLLYASWFIQGRFINSIGYVALDGTIITNWEEAMMTIAKID